jgi:hypothetical protein
LTVQNNPVWSSELENNEPGSDFGSWIISNKVYIYIKVKIKFTSEHATKAHRGSSGTALLFL